MLLGSWGKNQNSQAFQLTFITLEVSILFRNFRSNLSTHGLAAPLTAPLLARRLTMTSVATVEKTRD